MFLFFGRGYDVIPVRTKDLHDKIQQVCKVRNDERAETARGRLEFAQDLHAADAAPPSVLCQLSDGKQIPNKLGNDTSSPLLLNDTDSKRVKGRPRDTVKSKAFFKVTEVLLENDKEQFTISDLVRKMQEYLEGTGETPVRCCIHERNVTGTLWRENSDHNCE